MKKQGYLYWGNIPDIPRISGKRPFLVLSNNEMNQYSVIVAPLRSVQSSIKTNIPISSEKYPLKDGIIALGEITTIPSNYLEEEICELRDEEFNQVKEILKTLFSL
ncbi:type II toxin-antitoxin system PemK/MazF family toxin [Parageobacillus thermoglucosidasius]|uniref:type II toxin-antitoxin system PemK/MazF family toxin n=1 Tax=Parageobacillus thermoglucosidasius TaxID=1426 RepID=UPI003B6835E3